jgi:drug/metabolite transporter (DMT)-like permease
MRPLAWLGIAFIVFGGIIIALGGVSYTKKRNDLELGPLRVATVEKGFVPPMVGVGAVLVGAVLLFTGRRRRA